MRGYVIELDLGKGIDLSDSCGLARIEENGQEHYVVFGKIWPDTDFEVQGRLLGRGATVFQAMKDTILRLLEFRRKALTTSQLKKSLQHLIEIEKEGGDYNVLPYICESGEVSCNGDIRWENCKYVLKRDEI